MSPKVRPGAVWMLMALPALCEEPKKPAPDPRISSVHPMGSQAGGSFETTVRGAGLAGARAVLFSTAGISGQVVSVKNEPPDATLVRIAVTIPSGVAPGNHPFRLVTDGGVTNEGRIRVTRERTVLEGEPLGALPVVAQGVLAQKGEIDAYCFEAAAGDTYTFETSSGSAALDPSVSLWAASNSWFDSHRQDRIAYNDEPLHFPGLDHEARLVHRFDKSGHYCLKIGAFSGGGGPDFAYQLLFTRQTTPEPVLHPTARPAWTERLFTRGVNQQWLNQVAVRGNAAPPAQVEIYKAVPEGSPSIPVMTPNGIVEGRLGRAAEAHQIRLKLDKPQDLAIEIETPEATMPRFNPIVRLMQPDGYEMATNVHTKRNNNGLYMMKMIQPKTTVTLRSAGEYLLEIRDITTDCWAPDFAYRVLVRSQIAHVGAVQIVEDHVNVEPGRSKPVTIHVEREEGFKGYVAVAVEGLPEGVTAVTAMENPIEKPPLPNAGRIERYVGIPQTTSVMLMAAPDAKPSAAPVNARVTVRPVVDGRPGEVIASKALPVMVVNRRPS